MAEGSILNSLLTNAWGWVLILVFFNGAIVIHELGHFLAAKWRGLKVERFSIFGLGPKIFGWRGKDGVEYCFCWIPFGAFVALPQLADMKTIEGDSDDADRLPPISYADKMIVAFAGPFFNLCLAVILATCVWVFGTPTDSAAETTVVGYVAPLIDVDSETTVVGPASRAGLQPGDRILEIDSKLVNNWQDVAILIATGSGRDKHGNPKADLLIEREGETMPLEVFPVLITFNERSGRDLRRIGISPAEAIKIHGVMEDSPAMTAGLQPGDVIESYNGIPLRSLLTLNDHLQAHPDEPVNLNVLRNGSMVELTITAADVAQTKPLAKITFDEASDDYIQIIPMYDPATTGDPASPDTPAQLIVFDIAEGSALSELVTAGETVTQVNGQAVNSITSLIAAANQRTEGMDIGLSSRGKANILAVETPTATTLVPPLSRSMIGFGLQRDFVIAHPTPPKQFVEAIRMIGRVLGSLLSPSSDIGFNDLNGAVGIGRLVHSFSNPANFETKWDGFRAALAFAVILNVNLALLNLLPIPVLDGGHMTIATLSKVTGRKMPQGMIEAATGVFVMLLFGMMIYITVFDSLDWVGDKEAKQRELRQQSYFIQPTFRAPTE